MKNEIDFDPIVFFEFKRRAAIDFVFPLLIQRGTKSEKGPWHQREIDMYCQFIFLKEDVVANESVLEYIQVGTHIEPPLHP